MSAQTYAQKCQLVEERVRDEVRTLRLDPLHDVDRLQGLIDRISAEVVIGNVTGEEGLERSVAAEVAQVAQAAHTNSSSGQWNCATVFSG